MTEEAPPVEEPAAPEPEPLPVVEDVDPDVCPVCGRRGRAEGHH